MLDQQDISKKWVIVLSAIALLLIFLFCVVNFLDYNIIKKIQVTDIDHEGIVTWDIDQLIFANNYVWIKGWALVVSEPPRTFDLNVILKNTLTGETIELPTMLVNRNDLNELFPDGTDYTQSGFLARGNNLLVDLDNNTYDIYLKYFNNDHHLFIQTGRILQK